MTTTGRPSRTLVRDAWLKNMRTISGMRTVAALLGGIVCGSFGVEGWRGLLGYPLTRLALVALFALRHPMTHVIQNWSEVVLADPLGSLMTYVFAWTVAHNLVYLFI